MKDLIKRHWKAYGFIINYFEDHHESPTLGEIATKMKCSRQGAAYMRDRLEKMGMIKVVEGERGIRLKNHEIKI